MDKNKVTLKIANKDYTILTTSDPSDVEALASVIDKSVSDIKAANPRISDNQALVITALDLAEAAKKNNDVASKYKKEIADYLKDAERAQIERDRYKRELEKIKSERKQEDNG